MKSIFAGICVAALATSFVQAGDDKDLKKVIEDQGIYVETAQKGVVLSGYVDTSYTYQFAGNVTGGQVTRSESGPVGQPSSEANGREFDRTANSFNINAVKIALEKPLPDENRWAAGFRTDLMFGSDAKVLGASDTAVNDGTSGFALEQAYAQFRVPIGNGLDFKIGKMVSLLGYEVIESPANLNFSRGLLFSNAIPIMNTGLIASYKFNDIVDAQFGIVDAWNQSQSDTNFQNQGFGKAITGRVNVTAPGKNANVANSFFYSPEGEPGTASTNFNNNGATFVDDINGSWAPKFADDKLLFGFDALIGFADKARQDANFGAGPTENSTWFGTALYAKYQFTKLFSLAGRGEYLHSNNGLKFSNLAAANVTGGPDADLVSFTLTAGFNIWENLLTRVEYRYDQSTNSYINGGDQHQIALNVVYTF